MRFCPLVARLVLGAALLVAVASARATTVVPLSAAEVDEHAARIVEGRCTAIRPGPAGPDRPASTEFVFDVERVLKDVDHDERLVPGGSLVVRQVGGPAAADGTMRIVGMPEYEVGKRYRLALNSDSALGLTSPVGMGQGVRALPDSPLPATGARP